MLQYNSWHSYPWVLQLVCGRTGNALVHFKLADVLISSLWVAAVTLMHLIQTCSWCLSLLSSLWVAAVPLCLLSQLMMTTLTLQSVSGCGVLSVLSQLTTHVLILLVCEWLWCLNVFVFQASWGCLSLSLQSVSNHSASLCFMPIDNVCPQSFSLWAL